MGFLPDSKWGINLDRVLAGTRHGVFNGLWMGPGQPGTIAVGLFTSPAAAGALVARYRHDAVSILYPYPRVYGDGAVAGDSIDFMLMTLPRGIVLQPCANKPEE